MGARKNLARDPYGRVDEGKKSSDIINPY
jgi:hypothetical protein